MGPMKSTAFHIFVLVVWVHAACATNPAAVETRARIKDKRRLEFSLSDTPAPVGQPVALTMTHLEDYHGSQSQQNDNPQFEQVDETLQARVEIPTASPTTNSPGVSEAHRSEPTELSMRQNVEPTLTPTTLSPTLRPSLPPTLIPSPRPTPHPTGPRPTPFPTHKPPTPWPTLQAGGGNGSGGGGWASPPTYQYPHQSYPVYVAPTLMPTTDNPSSVPSDFPTEIPSSDPTSSTEPSAHPTL